VWGKAFYKSNLRYKLSQKHISLYHEIFKITRKHLIMLKRKKKEIWKSFEKTGISADLFRKVKNT
jgi:hypothetical protein